MSRNLVKIFSLIGMLCALASVSAQTVYQSTRNSNIDIELESIGSLSISNLYFSYIMLGTVGESFTQEIYDAEVTTDIAEESKFLNEKSRSTLQALINNRLISSTDLEIMYMIIDSYNLLIHTAESLIEYASGNVDKRSFEVFRDQAWQTISILLGMNGH